MIKVLKAGLQTTVQDLGRFGYRNYGVPISGVMDSISANIANGLLNNEKDSAVLEITLLGPILEFQAATSIAITGAEMSVSLNNTSILNYKSYFVNKGDVLQFGRLKKGVRSYLAVKGGFQTTTVLGSKSYYDGITSSALIIKNDVIPFHSAINAIVERKGVIKANKQFYDCNELEAYQGPEFDLFSPKEHSKLLTTDYTVSNRINRMGYRLEEFVLPHEKRMITGPVLPGTVQLMPSGQLIVLMKDAQTTGGYPRIFQLTEKSIAILAQKSTGNHITFKITSY